MIRFIVFVATLTLALTSVSPAHAQTASMLTFQGIIQNDNGPISAPARLEFRIYDAEVGGNLVDMDGDGTVEDVIGEDAKQVNVTPTNGIVAAKFGPVSPAAFRSCTPESSCLWLQVTVDGTPLTRLEIVTPPGTAEQVNERGSNVPAVLADPDAGLSFRTVGTERMTIDRVGLVKIGDLPNNVGRLPGVSSAVSRLEIMDTIPNVQDGVFQPLLTLTAFFVSDAPQFGQSIDFHVNNSGSHPPAARIVQSLDKTLQTGDTAGVLSFLVSPTRGAAAEKIVSVTTSGISVRGTTRTEILQITGGADVAEPFTINQSANRKLKIEPGMVVVIDHENPGQLRLAAEPYDRRVAGIISGANGLKPGMVMNAEGRKYADGEYPVALTGRVWCYCDASFGAIEPGDRLTTASTPGHAMKVVENERAPGAVIGKAMTSLNTGIGLVLVLVQPQ